MIKYYTKRDRSHKVEAGSILLESGKKLYKVTTFPESRAGSVSLQLWEYNSGGEWICLGYRQNRITQVIWEYYCNKNGIPYNRKQYGKYMKHPCARKKSAAGQRENVNAITDYECSKNPLHDFPRYI